MNEAHIQKKSRYSGGVLPLQSKVTLFGLYSQPLWIPCLPIGEMKISIIKHEQEIRNFERIR
jgi:hypothetical protein